MSDIVFSSKATKIQVVLSPESLNFVWETPRIGHVIDTDVTSPIWENYNTDCG